MATKKKNKSKKSTKKSKKLQPVIKVAFHRQYDNNAIWISWKTDSKVLKKSIKKKVWKKYKDKNKKEKEGLKATATTYKKALAGFVIKLYYRVSTKKGQNTWFLDNTLTTGKGTLNTSSQLWTPPDNAIAIKATVKAVSKSFKKDKKGNTSPWFKAGPVEKTDGDFEEIPNTPSISNFKIENMTGTVLVSYETAATGNNNMSGGRVEIETLSNSTKMLYFRSLSSNNLATDTKNGVISYVDYYYTPSEDTTVKSGKTYYTRSGTSPNYVYTKVKNPSGNPSTKGYYEQTASLIRRKTADNTTGQTEFTINYPIVGSYQVRCRVASKDTRPGTSESDFIYSDWSGWSSSIDTRPAAPTGVRAKTYDSDKIQILWDQVTNITQYEIEYVEDKIDYFDSSMLTSVTVENATSKIIAGFASGHTYYFRVRSVNSAAKSDPSEIVDAMVAIKPEAPTTWSSKSVGTITNDRSTTSPIYIYWVHNTVDGSAQRSAIAQFTIADTSYYYYKENTALDDYGELKDEITEVNIWDIEVYTSEEFDESAGYLHTIFLNSSADTLKWKVKTKGIAAAYSDYSVERSINIYIQPNLELTVTGGSSDEPLPSDVLTEFPLHLVGVTTPASQTPISYSISIAATTEYTTTDIYGDDEFINNGDIIFSEYLDTNEQLDRSISANDVDFASDITYTLSVIVAMDSGLTAEASYTFTVEWEEVGVVPDAMVLIDSDYFVADITPYAAEYLGYINEENPPLDPTAYIGTGITGDLEEPTIVSGSGVENADSGDIYFNSSTFKLYTCVVGGDSSTATWLYKYTFDYDTAQSWYSGTGIGSEDEFELVSTYPNSGVNSAVINDYYMNTDTGLLFRCSKAGAQDTAIWEYVWNLFEAPVANTELSVYRRDATGNYITIAESISNNTQANDDAISVRDLHPNFGTVTYRIVSRDMSTGALAFTDIEEVNSYSSVVIQWDEEWADENDDNVGDIVDENIYKGSILELPANIKLSDKNTNDVAVAEYIGRSRPVSYYGTQNGENSTINCEFPKSDTDTLSKLRQLMVYMGNVYIREPSGLGYWATINVSYNRNFKELTIPVTIDIRPVEGGM